MHGPAIELHLDYPAEGGAPFLAARETDWVGAATNADRLPAALALRDIADPAAAAATANWVGTPTGPAQGASPTGAGGLLLFFMNPLAGHEDEFNAWYDDEHIPRLAAVPGILSARRFRATRGEPLYLALYHLVMKRVVAGRDWQAAARSPWTDRVKGLTSGHLRLLLEPRA